MADTPGVDIHIDGDLLVLTYSGTFENADLERVLGEVAQVVRQPGRAWHALSDFRQVRLVEMGGRKIITQFGRDNKPYVARSAILGVDGMRRILFDLIVKVAGRTDTMRAFDDPDAAMAWLQREVD